MISVVIPSYNRAALIERSARSVLDQTYRDLELIIVDDCSTDQTEEVVAGLGDGRVRYIRHEENRGACAARNTGIDAARGEYIAFQDSDDVWYPEKLAKQIAALEKTGADFAFCRMISHGGKKGDKIVPSEKLKESDLNLDRLLMSNFVSTQMMVGTRECIRSTRFDSQMPRLQDWEFAIRVFQTYKVAFVDEVLVEQFIQGDSITRDDSRLEKAHMRIYEKHGALFQERPKAHARILKSIGYACRNTDSLRSKQYYKQSMKVHFTLGALAHYVGLR